MEVAAPGGPEIRLDTRLDTTRNGGNAAETPVTPGGGTLPAVGTLSVGTDGPYHSTREG